MLLAGCAVAVGVALLMWSSDKFVEGAAALATKFGVSQLLVGMIIVGFGTSLPEMTVSALAALNNTPGIALGNAYGSNIANITLILGVTAVINPVPVRSTILRRELPLLGVVTLFAVGQLAWNGFLSRWDGVLLMVVFALAMWVSVRNEKSVDADPLENQVCDEMEDRPSESTGRSVMWVVVGLTVLVASSRILVWGAVEIAHALGVSDLTIGLTIVAIGTSLPELASSVAAARKNHHDIAVGNVIGSNLFNTLVVVGIAALVRPITIAPALMRRDIPALIAATALLYLVCVGRKGKAPIVTRSEGLFLLLMFAAYTTWVAVTAVG